MQIEAVAFDDERGRVGALFVPAMPIVVLLRAVTWHGRHVAAPHGDGRAGVKRRLRGGLVRARFERLLIEVAVPAQPGDHPSRRAHDDRVQILGRRLRGRVKEKLAPGVAREHAVESDQVIMDVEVQGTEPLNEVDRAALRSLNAVALRARAVAREHALDEETGDRGEHVGLERDELAKFVG